MKLKKKKILKLLILALVILIIASLLVFILNYYKNKEYEPYKEKMETYGFDRLYNNQKATSFQKVTKLEAIKIIISSALDSDKIEGYTMTDNNESWISYALKLGIISTNEQDSINSKATYIDVLRYLSNTNYYVLDNQYNTETKPDFKDYNSYLQMDKINITDMVSNGIIDNSTNKLNGNKYISKGLFNKLVTTFYEKIVLSKKYGTIQTDKDKMPSNSQDYPFILDGIDNKVYEEEFKKDTSGEIKNPNNYYIDIKEYYDTIRSSCEEYYNYILNIDYRTINEKEFKDKIQKYTVDIISDYTVEKYVNYVKNNKIIMKGKATVQMPIVYNDGFYCRARTKLEVNVIESNTLKNILFLDLSSKDITYKNKDFTIYVDNLFSFTIDDSKKPLMKLNPIKDILLDISKDSIIIEENNKEGE